MSDMKFTPGPWTVNDTHPSNACLYISSSGDLWQTGDVATVYCAGQSDWAANAHLIAAAPELYEVLAAFERVKDLWLPPETVGPEHYGEAEALHGLRRNLLSALAKSRGEL